MHILIVEDKKSLATTLKISLEEKGHTVVLAFDGYEGLSHAETGRFDVMVLDIMLPGIDGLELIQRLRKEKHRLPVLALTARDTVADIVAALDLGVDDYLTKPFAMAEFMARLRAVARKGPSVQDVKLEVADLVLDAASGQVTRAGVPVSLTRTQFALLEYLMRRAGHVLTREAIIERIWSGNPEIEANTLEVFIRSLRVKIDTGRERSYINDSRCRVPHGCGGRAMRPPPIRVRLTGWNLAVILISLVLYSIGMYFGLQRAIEDVVDQQLQARSESLAQSLQNGTLRKEQSGPQASGQGSSLVLGDELYQVADEAGSVLYQSPTMRQLDVPLDTNRLRHHYRHRRDDGDFTTYYHRQGDVRVLASKVQLGGETYHVQVATVVSPLYEALQTYRVWVWTGLPIILCLAGLAGYWLSGRAMRPVYDVVRSTREISERSLYQRLKVPEAQDELRELTVTMNGMLARLESAFTRITRFTSDASHELRTPITVIRTLSEVILERDRSVQEYRDMVGQILRESELTSELIEQLLTLARTDADTEQLSLEPVDLCELVQELEPANRTLAESHDLRWLATVPMSPVLVQGDRPHLRRLLLILIENACRYTAGGGSVELMLTIQNDEAVMEVRDTGIGIPADDLTHIFDRFYRASNARFFAPDGSGLGLSIAHWVAGAHGGSLSAQSMVGSGTSMVLRLMMIPAAS